VLIVWLVQILVIYMITDLGEYEIETRKAFIIIYFPGSFVFTLPYALFVWLKKSYLALPSSKTQTFDQMKKQYEEQEQRRNSL
jgi:hypothetical protein